MILIQKFCNGNIEENVDSKISKLAAHNSNLEKKLDFPANRLGEEVETTCGGTQKQFMQPFWNWSKELPFLLNKVDDSETKSSGFKGGEVGVKHLLSNQL